MDERPLHQNDRIEIGGQRGGDRFAVDRVGGPIAFDGRAAGEPGGEMAAGGKSHDADTAGIDGVKPGEQVHLGLDGEIDASVVALAEHCVGLTRYCMPLTFEL